MTTGIKMLKTLLTKAIAVSLGLGLVTTNMPHIMAQPTSPPDSNEIIITNDIAKKLLGVWETKEEKSGVSLFKFIFTPEGKFYIITSDKTGDFGIEFTYHINPNTQPMELDIIEVSEGKTGDMVKTIFEFTPEGKLRIETDKSNPGQPRPTSFSPKDLIFNKISDEASLPKNIKLINNLMSSSSKSGNSEGKTYITTLNRAQQAYYLEKGKFSRTISDLGLGIKENTNDYSYRIIRIRPYSVITIAQAKKSGLKSYSSAVFLITNSQGELTTITGICETKTASKKSPPKPRFLKRTKKIKCEGGSILLNN